MPAIDFAIQSFHEAAIMPDRWPKALDVLADSLDSRGVTLVLEATTLSTMAVSGSVQPFVSAYLAFPTADPREARVYPTVDQGFMPDRAYFSTAEIRSDPFYQEFLAPRDFGWNAVAALQDRLFISVKRSFSCPAYDGVDLERLNATLPWLRCASRTARLTWSAGFAGQLSAFEKLQRGAILIDRNARVIDCNACVRFGDGLDVSAGILRAPYSRDALQGFLSTLMRRDHLAASSAVVSVARPSGRRPWLLDGIACTEALRSLHSQAAALIIITDVDRKPQPANSLLRAYFGLTGTESALANALLHGESLRDAANLLAISEGHARQRLKAIFAKTRTSRQGELIALLTKVL